MKTAIGSDHAGFLYKKAIKELLQGLRHEVADFGTHSEEPVDYPLFIWPVAEGRSPVANLNAALCWVAPAMAKR